MYLTFRLDKPPDLLFEYLTDMKKFVSVHPVITQIDHKGGNSYLVHETLKIAFIPVSFTYPVTINPVWEKKTVMIAATVMKFTKIEMTFVLSTVQGGTLVEENIKFYSPFPIKPVMEKIFRKQHTELFKNIASL